MGSEDKLTRRCASGDCDNCPGSWTEYPNSEGPCEHGCHDGEGEVRPNKLHGDRIMLGDGGQDLGDVNLLLVADALFYRLRDGELRRLLRMRREGYQRRVMSDAGDELASWKAYEAVVLEAQRRVATYAEELGVRVETFGLLEQRT